MCYRLSFCSNLYDNMLVIIEVANQLLHIEIANGLQI